jgi:hypothetical protein
MGPGKELRLDDASARKLATYAIKHVYAANMGSWRFIIIQSIDNLDNPKRYGLRVSMGSISVHAT